MFGRLMTFISVGTVAMLLPIAAVAWLRQVKIWKSMPVALYATLTGTISTFLWFFVENLRFGGISFYGAVFLVPVAFLLAPKLFQENYGALLDMFAPAICMMLAVMKAGCYLTGCCGGRMLYINADELPVIFPSQLAELVNALLIMIVLLVLAYRKRFANRLYPYFMIFYGCTRFVLNFFREEWVTNTRKIPPLGTFWSILAISIGAIWLYLSKRRNSANTSAMTDGSLQKKGPTL